MAKDRIKTLRLSPEIDGTLEVLKDGVLFAGNPLIEHDRGTMAIIYQRALALGMIELMRSDPVYPLDSGAYTWTHNSRVGDGPVEVIEHRLEEESVGRIFEVVRAWIAVRWKQQFAKPLRTPGGWKYEITDFQCFRLWSDQLSKSEGVLPWVIRMQSDQDEDGTPVVLEPGVAWIPEAEGGDS